MKIGNNKRRAGGAETPRAVTTAAPIPFLVECNNNSLIGRRVLRFFMIFPEFFFDSADGGHFPYHALVSKFQKQLISFHESNEAVAIGPIQSPRVRFRRYRLIIILLLLFLSAVDISNAIGVGHCGIVATA